MAIKASRNISTPPTTGRTIGISGTIASTASCSWAGVALSWAALVVWSAGLDMGWFLKCLGVLAAFYPQEDGYMKSRLTKMPGAWFELPFAMLVCGRNA